ncbi:hypothetical protein M0805_001160 [Coniferiporia weirii]|nr:hypothetical protein M0805_001160 [Coniferiporia weirii]
MDDVWGNAWSQSEEHLPGTDAPSKLKVDDVSPPDWSFPLASSKHEETDVGLPSWSTGGLNWTEPTGQTSLWSDATAAEDLELETSGWGASSGMKLEIGSELDARTRVDSPVASIPPDEDEHYDVPTPEKGSIRSLTPGPAEADVPPTVNAEETESLHTDSGPVSTATAPSPPQSPDPFGSFEAGLVSVPTVSSLAEGEESWVSPVPVFDDIGTGDDAWGSSWENAAQTESDESPKDEWAIAQEEKRRRDRSVPPELLAAIVDRLNELSADLWPSTEKAKASQVLGNWRDGMSSVDGLDDLVNKILPRMASHPPAQFSGSHTAKAMAKSVKLSRNLAIVRNSPMSHLFTTKSLAAWELSVKSRVEVPRDDIPVGWRAVEPELKEESKPVSPEKKTGGILSFWSRRTPAAAASTGTVLNENGGKRPSFSREPPPSPSTSKASGSSPTRTSVDIQPLPAKMQHSSSMSNVSTILPTVPPMTSSSSMSSLPPSVESPTIINAAQNHDPQVSSVVSPAPSAVSRFFNRFSRAKSDMRSSSLSPRSSIALSMDDLEFLSDIVPSHSDEADSDHQLDALSALVSSPALPIKLPPPLAPPPLVPPPRPTSVTRPLTPKPRPSSAALHSAPSYSNLSFEFEEPTLQQPASRVPIQGPLSYGVLTPAVVPPLPPPLLPVSMAAVPKSSTPSPLSAGTPSRTSLASPPPRAWSPAAVASPFPKALSPPPSGPAFGSLSRLDELDAIANISGGSPIQSPLDSSPPATLLATPPSATQSHLQNNSHLRNALSPASSIPPPPIEKSPNHVYVKPTSVTFDDDFSDFQSPLFAPPHQEHVSMTFDASFGIPSDQSILTHRDTLQDESFGDFGDFVFNNNVIARERSPPFPASPPVPSSAVPPPPPKKRVPAQIETGHIRKPSTANHQATAKLVERAAAHQGRWPAPPSPLPNLLPPPPSGATSTKRSAINESLLELDEESEATLSAVEPKPTTSLKSIIQTTASVGERATSQHPMGSTPSLLNFDQPTRIASPAIPFQPLAPPLRTPDSLQMRPPSAAPLKGGLSAQDLSFFEGL